MHRMAGIPVLTGLPFGEKKIESKYIILEDSTEDFNSPEDYNRRTVKI